MTNFHFTFWKPLPLLAVILDNWKSSRKLKIKIGHVVNFFFFTLK